MRKSSIASANNQDGSAQPLTNLRINVEEPSLAAHISHHSSAQTQHAHSSSHPPAHSIINDEASESSTADATSTSSYLDHTSQTHASVEPSSSQPPEHTPSESALITALSLGLTTSLSTEALLTTIARLQTENQNLQGQNNVMRDQICQMGGHLVELGSIVSQRGSTVGSSSVGSFTGRSFLDGGGPNAIFVGLGGRQKSGEDPAEGLNKTRSKKRRSCGSNLTNSARSNATSGDTKGGINRFGYTNFRDYDGNNHMGSILSVDDSRHANDDDNADAENDEVDYLEDNENLKNQTQHKGLGDDHIEIEEDGDDDGGCEGDGDIESSFETGPSIANKFAGGARNDGGILDKEKYPATRKNRTSPRIHSESISNDVIQEDEKSESAAEDDQDIIYTPVSKIPIAQDIDMSFTEINAIIAEKYGEHNVPEAKNIYRPASVCGPAATDVGSKNTITSGKTVVSGGSDGDTSADVNSALECAAASHKSPQNIHHQEHDVLKHTLAVHQQQKHDSHKQRHERSTADEDLPCTHEEAAIKSSDTPIKKSRLKKIDHPQLHMKDEKQHQHQHPQLHTKALDSSISILDFEDLHISSNSLTDKNQHHHQGDHIQYNGLKASTSQLEITLVSQNDVLCDSEKVRITTINQSLLSNASSNQSSVSLNLETFSEGDEDEEDEDDSAVPEDASESEIGACLHVVMHPFRLNY